MPAQKFVILTSGSSWVVPADCSGTIDKLEMIGASGSSTSKAGGAGAGYTVQPNLVVGPPGTVVPFQIGVGPAATASQDIPFTTQRTWFLNVNLYRATGGGNALGVTGGPVGTDSAFQTGGSQQFGGKGGNGSSNSSGTGGGGGAAGPLGAGALAGASITNSTGATGGGGANGGVASATASGTTVTAGGNGPGGTLGGAAGGGNGGAGAGGGGSTTVGGAGGAGLGMGDGSVGPGGGGGGGHTTPGAGGLYGGGPGGGGAAGIAGTQGLIVITYTPVVKSRRIVVISG